MKGLRDSDRIYLDPVAQIVEVGSGRFVIRSRQGLSLMRGPDIADLRLLLDQIEDGTRLDHLLEHSPFEASDARAIIERLLGEVVFTGPLPPLDEPQLEASAVPDSLAIMVLCNDAGGQKIAEALGVESLTIGSFPEASGETAQVWRRVRADRDLSGDLAPVDEAVLSSRFVGKDLIICALSDVTGSNLALVQRAALRTDVAVLFLSAEPDGAVLGPLVVPGTEISEHCGRATLFRGLSGASETVAKGRNGWLDEVSLNQAHTLMVEEITDLARAEATPRSVGRIWKDGQWLDVVGQDPSENTEFPTSNRWQKQADRAVWDRAVSFQEISPQSRPGLKKLRVGILGGGTAGYLTALALRAKHPRIEVTLLESSDIGVIGVGEATTPLMPQFLHGDLDLDIGELFREVQPTFKLGIHFQWGQPGSAFSYPFGPMLVLPALQYEGHIRKASISAAAMEANRLPMNQDGGATFGADIAYHLENRRFVGWLKAKALERGVRHVDCRIKDVERSDETIKTLITDDGRRFEFDVYVDCSGFASVLMGKSQDSPFLPFDKSLFTDRALIAKVPHNGMIKPYTLAETMDAGWCWNTPQPECDHRGYVYAAAFLDESQARDEMLAKNPGMGEARLIRFQSGRRGHFWKGNVFALGNAYGFVEPLESTALHMLIRQIGYLLRAIQMDGPQLGAQAVLNRKVGDYWDYLCWFLAIHYKFNRYSDTPFWRACLEETDVSAYSELIESFRERGPLASDPLIAQNFDYPDPLWGAEGIDVILAGQAVVGHRPNPTMRPQDWHGWGRKRDAVVAASLSQAEALDLIEERPEILDAIGKAFKKPAF